MPKHKGQWVKKTQSKRGKTLPEDSKSIKGFDGHRRVDSDVYCVILRIDTGCRALLVAILNKLSDGCVKFSFGIDLGANLPS